MAKAITDTRKKKRAGRPRIGAVLIGVRIPPAGVRELDGWIERYAPDSSRPEAIRRLVRLGLLGGAKPQALRSEKNAAKAKELAAMAIDRLVDPATSAEELASRKRRLLKGPEEFRELRLDRGKAKGKA